MESTFELLKLRLVLRELDQVERAELHMLVLQEARAAAASALDTAFPCLIFPCLLQERVRAAMETHARVSRHYWGELEKGFGCRVAVSAP